jgi:hypothetical protein
VRQQESELKHDLSHTSLVFDFGQKDVKLFFRCHSKATVKSKSFGRKEVSDAIRAIQLSVYPLKSKCFRPFLSGPKRGVGLRL